MMGLGRRGIARPIVVAAAIALAACSGNADSADEGAAADASAVDRSNPAAVDSAAGPAAWTVDFAGVGPVRVGTTADVAMQALGSKYEPTAEPACEIISSSNLPRGVSLMAVDGRVVRVDVTEGTTATAAGARIGDTEARVRELYGARVQEMPHKYTDGEYLVVRAAEPADSALRIVFETDGQKVLRYRSGTEPQVEWVEGCA